MSKPSESESSTPLAAQQLNEAIVAVELRCRRVARDDCAAVVRGLLSDVLAHVETRVEARIERLVAEKLQSHTDALREMLEADRGYFARFRESIRDEIKAVTVETLQEYRVIDENGYVLPAAKK